jgi:17beta-estradiol 17-dehydrogenase / very-long-chain 3-oxoacyl-CoA reductase
MEAAIITIAITAFVIILSKITRFTTLFLRNGSLSRYNQTPSPWAIVTGASNGIGLAFAEELLAAGFNLILHGRNFSKLSAIRESLSATYPKASISIFVSDAAAVDTAGITAFATSIRDLSLRVLVNNVGGTGHMHVDFMTLKEHNTAEINDTIAINVLFTTHLTHAPVVPAPTSLILNTGSGSSIGLPYIAVYSGAKAYLSTWGKALSMEMQAEGLDIEVMRVLTGNTQSGQDSRSVTMMRPSSRTLARAALARIGCRRSAIVPYLAHALQAEFINMVPETAARWAIVKTFKQLKGTTLDGTPRVKQS